MGNAIRNINLMGYFIYGLTLLLFSSIMNRLIFYLLNIENNIFLDLTVFLGVAAILLFLIKNIPIFQKKD
ncbi:hypothetical protein J2Z83_003547 [Virgibacillus natechei]|uniref:Uncharacterized protein n=1 Tax=Virgibacillus natechei TaxID=1216297 RepID=A0ABS4IKL8_9BACI|nr:hypothetical protein [Virgibacillus natechei]